MVRIIRRYETRDGKAYGDNRRLTNYIVRTSLIKPAEKERVTLLNKESDAKDG
jgi:hypothetical protein